MGRAAFAVKSLGQVIKGQDKTCPYCGAKDTELVQRKHVIWHLRKCPHCLLMFRWPKDASDTNKRFYQGDYHEGYATEVPDPSELRAMIDKEFAVEELNYRRRIEIVRSISTGTRLLDYGASWGYGVWQFCHAGFDAVGFEIGAPRAAYGNNNLGIRIETGTSCLKAESFDIIHTAHVLEHISDLRTPFSDFSRLLKTDGVLVIFVPNGSGRLAKELGTNWGPLISEKHVNALTAEFFARNLPPYGFDVKCDSQPYQTGTRSLNDRPFLEGEELLIVARKTNSLTSNDMNA